jgi:hypothetical protein
VRDIMPIELIICGVVESLIALSMIHGFRHAQEEDKRENNEN